MLRDFSDAAKQKLLNYVDEVTANGTMEADWNPAVMDSIDQ